MLLRIMFSMTASWLAESSYKLATIDNAFSPNGTKLMQTASLDLMLLWDLWWPFVDDWPLGLLIADAGWGL